MRIIKFLIYALLSAGCASCGTSATSDASSEAVSHDTVADTSIISADTENRDLIKSVYDKFVFAIDTESEEINHPEKYFTAHALKNFRMPMISIATTDLAMLFMHSGLKQMIPNRAQTRLQ